MEREELVKLKCKVKNAMQIFFQHFVGVGSPFNIFSADMIDEDLNNMIMI